MRLLMLLRIGLVMLLLTPIPAAAQSEFVSPFKRQETPGAGFSPVLTQAVSGSATCQARDSSAPSVAAAAPVVEVGTASAICLVGFLPGQDVSLQITPPSGPVRAAVMTPAEAGSAQWPWLAAPEDPTGDYAVMASQGTAVATSSFRVAEATGPHVAVFPPYGAPGTSFRVVVVGAPSDAPFALYRRDGDSWRFATRLPVSNALHTEADDPVGMYLLQNDAPQGPGAVFELRVDPTAPPANSAHPLKRRDVPPGATSAQLYFGQGAGNALPCKVKEDADRLRRPLPSDRLASCAMTMGSEFTLEFIGFAPNRDLSVLITRPDGSTLTRTVRPDAEDGSVYVRDAALSDTRADMWQYDPDTAPDSSSRPDWWVAGVAPIVDFDPLPGDPFGDYQVDVSQGQLHGSGHFSVSRRSEPHVRVLAGRTFPGDTVRVLLTGFAPGQPLPVHLYAGKRFDPAADQNANYSPFGQYLTTQISPPTDQFGNVVYELKTEPDDTPGMYVVDVDGASTFWIARSFELGKDGRWFETPERHLQQLAYATIAESDHAWSTVITPNGQPASALERFLVGSWLETVRTSVQRLEAAGGYRVAHLTTLSVDRVSLLPDGRVEAFATETWDDGQFSANGTLERDFSGTLDQRYVFERIGDSWLIVDSQIVRH